MHYERVKSMFFLQGERGDPGEEGSAVNIRVLVSFNNLLYLRFCCILHTAIFT